MFLIEKISSKVGHALASNLDYNKDQEEVLTYGVINFLQIIYSFSLIIIISSIFHVLFEGLVISVAISILRKYSGGAHSSSPNRCAVIGAVISACFGILSVYLSKRLTFEDTLLLMAISFVYSCYCIYKYAPAASPSKPINSNLKRKRLRRKSFLILSFIFIITAVFVVLYNKSRNITFLKYADCFVIGAVWQTFTLTCLGHKLLSKADSVF